MGDQVPGGIMLDALSSTDPSKVQNILGLGTNPEKESMLLQQMRMAQALRDTPNPDGRGGTGFGRVYTAPNPMEVIAQKMMQYKGISDMNKIKGQQDQLIKDTQQGHKDMLDILRNYFQTKGGGLPGSQQANVASDDPSIGQGAM